MKARKIVIGNWKMKPETLAEAKKLFSGTKRDVGELKQTRVVVCPPHIYLSEFSNSNKRGGVFLGAQDVFWKKEGAHTGEVSAPQLANIGVSYVIIGHSERRALGETGEVVSRKTHAALTSQMSAVVCVGEPGRDEGARYLDFLENEIKESLRGISRNLLSGLIIAYEPIWAIGKSAKDAMNSHELHKMSIFIKKALAKTYGREAALKIPVIYGGSVETENAEELIKSGDIRGFLVGHQSLDNSSFKKIAKIVDSA